MLVLIFTPLPGSNTKGKSWTSLANDLNGSLDELGWDFLEPVGHDVLFERRQVLGDQAVNLVVLLPQL